MTDKEESFFRKRITELADTCFQKNVPTHSWFLNADEQAVLETMHLSAAGARMVLDGGFDASERKAACFLPDYMDRVPEDLFSYLKISPAQPKFADELTHRDFLGALMNLGMERKVFGDICVSENSAHLVILGNAKETVLEELTSVKHTTVTVTEEARESFVSVLRTEILDVNSASLRADSLIASVWHFSRTRAKDLVTAEKVFRNGAVLSDGSTVLKPGDLVSVRGYGRFRLLPDSRQTKKGRLYVRIELFV